MTPDIARELVKRLTDLRRDVDKLIVRDPGPARISQLYDIDFVTDALQPHQILRYKSDEQIWVNRYTALFTGPALSRTVAAGVIDVATSTTSTNITILGEGGVADDVDTIDSDQAGHIIVVRRDPSTTITLKDGTGNLRLPADIVLDSDEKAVWLLYTGSNDWIPIAGYGSGATGPVTPHVHAGEDITSGTVADARIASTITRDSEVFSIVLANDGAGSGLDADLLDGLSSAAFALVSHVHAGEDITSGTIADARIASTITRDSEVFSIVLANDGAGSGLDADLLDGLSSAAFALAVHTHTASQITDFTEAAQDVIGALLVDSSTINYTYNDGANTLTTAVIPGGIDHGGLAGLSDDDHTIYALLAGRAGGQQIYGGTAADEDLFLDGTAHATKTNSYVAIQAAGGPTVIGGAPELTTKLHVVGGDIVVDNTRGYRGRQTDGTTRLFFRLDASDIAHVGSSGGGIVSHFHGGDDAVFVIDNFKIGMGVLHTITSLVHIYENTSAVDATAGVTIEQDGAGDAVTQYLLTGGQRWVEGIDNSDSDAYGWAAAVDLANKLMRLSTAGLLDIKAGTSSGVEARVGGVMSTVTTVGANVGAGEDNVASYSVPASALANDGDSVWMKAAGSMAATAASKTIKVHFGTSGTTLILDTGAVFTTILYEWWLEVQIFRTGAATQKASAIIHAKTAGSGVITLIGHTASLNQTLSGAVTIRITGTGTNDNDITCNWAKVGFDPANS